MLEGSVAPIPSDPGGGANAPPVAGCGSELNPTEGICRASPEYGRPAGTSERRLWQPGAASTATSAKPASVILSRSIGKVSSFPRVMARRTNGPWLGPAPPQRPWASGYPTERGAWQRQEPDA